MYSRPRTISVSGSVPGTFVLECCLSDSAAYTGPEKRAIVEGHPPTFRALTSEKSSGLIVLSIRLLSIPAVLLGVEVPEISDDAAGSELAAADFP